MLLAFGVWLWRMDTPAGPDMSPADAPFWAVFPDYLLAGPDAGAWASNASALYLGRPGDLDAHRLPTMPYAIAALMRLHADPALAGHLWNHLCHLLLPVVTYFLGRSLMGRGMALGAGLAVAMYPPLLLSSYRFGVDPTVASMMPLALLAGLAASWRWWLGPLAGGVVALAAACHLTALGIAVPAVVLSLFAGQRGWRRWAAALGVSGGVALTIWWIFQSYPYLPWELFKDSLAEGVTPTGVEGRLPSQAAAVAAVQAGGASAVDEVVAFLARTVRPRWMPWYAAVLLPWLGLAGIGLAAREGPDRPVRPPWFPRAAWAVGRELAGIGAGIPLVMAMAPMVAFAAAGSPERYTQNFYPFGVLLLFRGGAVVTTAIDRILGHYWPRWPAQVLGLVVGCAWAYGLWDAQTLANRVKLAPLREDIATWRLGHLIAEHFEPGGGASCTEREAVAYAARSYCPATVCPGPPVPDVGRCIEVLRAECGGEGDIPYVIVVKRARDDRSESRKALDAWVAEHFTPIASLDDDLLAARIYGLPRDP